MEQVFIKMNQGINWGNDPRPYFLLTVLGIILYLVLDIIAQLLPPHYSPITQAESLLAVGPYGYIMTVNFLIRGLLSFSFITGFIITVYREKSRYKVGLVLLGLWSIGAIILAFFPADVNLPITLHGTIHLITALTAFISGSLGILILSISMRTDNRFESIIKYVLPLSISSVICLALLPVIVFGLIERIFIASVLLWMLIISIYLVNYKN
ncbi:MAG TPA: DUF998 domain-containing protein [Methanobacterium sp.]|nr:DUF998 domain-containing protein [Methanobacterium sp.]